MLLTNDERQKFAQWLEILAASNKGIAEQAKALGPVGEIIAKRELIEAAAAILIADKLRATETVSI